MKKSLLLCLLLAYGLIGYAQSSLYDSAIHYRMSPSFYVAADTLIQQAIAADPGDTLEGSDANTLRKWKYFMGSRISLDVPNDSDMYAPMGAALSSYRTYFADYCPGSGYTGSWSCLGPFTGNYGVTADYADPSCEAQGRIISLWVNPISQSILAGADGGGLWKSTNNGHTWHNLTDGFGGSSVLGMPGPNCIVVDPLDTNRIYIALTADAQYKKSGGYHLGIAYSTDGGSTWQADTGFNNLPSVNGGYTDNVTMVFIPGTHELVAIYKEYVLYKPDAGTAWSDITPWSSGTRWADDIEISHQYPYKAVITASSVGGTSGLWLYDGSTWTDNEMSLPSPYSLPVDWQGARNFTITANDTAYIVDPQKARKRLCS